MIDEELKRILKLMSKFLKHKDGCFDGPDFANDSRKQNCNCGLQKVRRMIKEIIVT